MDKLLNPANWVEFGFAGIAYVCVFGLLYWVLKSSFDERKDFRAELKNAREANERIAKDSRESNERITSSFTGALNEFKESYNKTELDRARREK